MKLTKELLWRLGFHSEGKDVTNKPAYRLKDMGLYCYGELQIVIGNYPDSNPNSGIVSIYQPELKDQHCMSWTHETEKKKIDKKLDYVENKDADGITYGIKYVTFPAKTIPIASSVTTLERLNAIYTALTGNKPLVPRPDPNKAKK